MQYRYSQYSQCSVLSIKKQYWRQSFETLFYKLIYSKCSYFAQTLRQSAASATVQPHNTSITQNIFLHNKLWLLFIDTITNSSQKATNYIVNQSLICNTLLDIVCEKYDLSRLICKTTEHPKLNIHNASGLVKHWILAGTHILCEKS